MAEAMAVVVAATEDSAVAVLRYVRWDSPPPWM